MLSKAIPAVFLTIIASVTATAIGEESSMSYPFVASKERQEFVKLVYRKVKIGHSNHEVRQLLGTPEIVLPLYEPKIKNPKRIGSTYWYILQRLKARGSKGEKLVRISFDLAGRVTAVDQWGLENEQ